MRRKLIIILVIVIVVLALIAILTNLSENKNFISGLKILSPVDDGDDGGDAYVLDIGSDGDDSTDKGDYVAECGNSNLDPGEECDGIKFVGGVYCVDYSSSYIDGKLICDDCNIDTSECIREDGSVGGGEIGDGVCDAGRYSLTSTSVLLSFDRISLSSESIQIFGWSSLDGAPIVIAW